MSRSKTERRDRRGYRGRPCARTQLGAVVIHHGADFPLAHLGIRLRECKRAYAHNSAQVFTHQCTEVNQFVTLWLPFGQVSRHAEQFTTQMSCLLLPKATFEAGLCSCPVSSRFVKLRRPSAGEYDAQSPIALSVGRSSHEFTPEQGFKRPNESCSVHHHCFGQLSHSQIRTTAQRPENAELRGRDAGGGHITLVKLRYVPRGLAKGETVVVLKIIRGHMHRVMQRTRGSDTGKVTSLLPLRAPMTCFGVPCTGLARRRWCREEGRRIVDECAYLGGQQRSATVS
jgi:hypothetical protein